MGRDLREALRALVSNPGFTAVIVLTLALTIGANTTIFSALYGVLLRPLDYDEPDRLMMLWENNPKLGIAEERVSAATYIDWRSRSKSFIAMAAYRNRGFTLLQGDEPVRLAGAEVSPALFRVLKDSPILGRTFTEDEEKPGNERLVILSYAAWRDRFGSNSSINGTTVRLDGEPYTVVGVMPRRFTFPPGNDKVEAWSPLTLNLGSLLSRPHRMYNCIGRLAAGVTLAGAREEMESIAVGIARENPDSNRGWSVNLVPAQEQIVGNMRLTLWFLFGAVLLVLLIGCVNIANLMLARSIRSAKDFAVRAALGAGRIRLMRRTLAESLILSVLGGVAGLLVAYWGVAILRSVMPESFPRLHQIAVDRTVLAFTAVTSLAAGLAFGLVPAIRAVRQNLVSVLQEGGHGALAGRKTRSLANGMVMAQVAIAFVLLIGAVLMIRSFARLLAVDPGFRKENVVSIALSLPQSRYAGFPRPKQFFLDLVQRVQALPGLRSAGAVSALPMSPIGTEFEMPFTLEGFEVSSPSERPRAQYRAVIPGYFQAMGIPLLTGRLFDETDSEQKRRVVLINETLRRRYFSDQEALGRLLRRMPMLGDMEIVGVVGDIHHYGLQQEVRPEVFVPFAQLPLREMQVVVHSRLPINQIASMVKAEVHALDSELPITAISKLDELVSASVAQPRFNTTLLIGLALCAGVLAAVGIYGVISYSVARRTGEIGLRMALGAGTRDTIWLILKEDLLIILVGGVVGTGAAVSLSRFVDALLFGVTGTDLTTYTLVASSLLLVGLLAATVPVLRASHLDPVAALRHNS